MIHGSNYTDGTAAIIYLRYTAPESDTMTSEVAGCIVRNDGEDPLDFQRRIAEGIIRAENELIDRVFAPYARRRSPNSVFKRPHITSSTKIITVFQSPTQSTSHRLNLIPSVSIVEAEFAVVGTHPEIGNGILSWHVRQSDADFNASYLNTHGGQVRAVTALEANNGVRTRRSIR